MLTDFIVTTVWVALVAAIVIRVTAWLEKGNEEIERALLVCLDQEAADHNEPSREQVEAEWWPWMDARDEVFGPRALWGPTDVEADREWADILAAVDLTPEEMQERYEAARIADRIDKIRADIACNQFRRELEDFDGGVA